MEMKTYQTNSGKMGQIYFFRTKEKDDKDWELAFVAFHFTDTEKLKTKYVYTQKGITYNKNDKGNLDKKMKEYIEWLKIKEQKRVSNLNTSSYNSYYDY